MVCKSCKQEIEEDSEFCTFCGAKQNDQDTKKTKAKQEVPSQAKMEASVSDKEKAIATMLAILFGWAGFHYFYVGRIGRGIWRFLLAVIAACLIYVSQQNIAEYTDMATPLFWAGIILFGLLLILAILIDAVVISFGHFKDSKGRYLK